MSITPDGSVSRPETLSCWYDGYTAKKELAIKGSIPAEEVNNVEPADVYMTLVVPAYNEEERLSGMLEEAVEYLTKEYAGISGKEANGNKSQVDCGFAASKRAGWEILVVNDGSKDKTVETALSFARSHQLAAQPPTPAGPWTTNDTTKTRTISAPKVPTTSTSIPSGSIRVISLEQNRGKGGAVTHGMRHARGEYIVFADADGASRFSDLGKLVEGCDWVKDARGRAVGIGSRAHLVGSEAVVKVRREPQALFPTLTGHSDHCYGIL